jgi:hypothetical protein
MEAGMISKNTTRSLDDSIQSYTAAKNAPGIPAFGIELELEEAQGKEDQPWPYAFWHVKNEPSLRNNGAEFISYPAEISVKEKVCEELQTLLKKWPAKKPEATIRCSTHIHMNVAYLTLRQVYHTLLAWYLVENLVVKTQSDWRQGNLFCLRMMDAESISDHLIKGARHPDQFLRIHQKDYVKYAALNLAPIYTFGTIEFRFLSPITDPKLLCFWVDVFQNLINYGAKIKDPRQVLQGYENNDIKGLFKLFFAECGPVLYRMVEAKYHSYELMTRSIHKNYDNIFELTNVLKDQRFEVSPLFWNPDDQDPKVPAQIEAVAWSPEDEADYEEASPPAGSW